MRRCLRAYDPFFGRQARLFHELFEGFDQEREEHERTFDETQMRDFMDVFIRECRRANEEGDTGACILRYMYLAACQKRDPDKY